MNRQDYKHMVIIGSIIFAWIMILFFCAYKPYEQMENRLNTQIAENQQFIADIKMYKQKYQDLNKYQIKLQNNEQLLQEKVPANLLEDEVLIKLNELAKSSEVAIISLKPEAVQVENTYSREDIKLSLSGDYFHILRFLRQLNISPRLIMIKQGSISLQENQMENNLLICNLTLQIYADNYNN